MRKAQLRTMTAALGAAMLVTVGATTAAGTPDTRLPDADLFCEEATLAPDEWVALPQAGSLWIEEGPMAGHYVVLEATHYLVPGLFYDLDEFTDPETGVPKVRGNKTGLESIQCTVVSRFDVPVSPFTVFAPMTIAKVSG